MKVFYKGKLVHELKCYVISFVASDDFDICAVTYTLTASELIELRSLFGQIVDVDYGDGFMPYTLTQCKDYRDNSLRLEFKKVSPA